MAQVVICEDCEREIDPDEENFCCPECGAEPLCEACYMRRHLHND